MVLWLLLIHAIICVKYLRWKRSFDDRTVSNVWRLRMGGIGIYSDETTEKDSLRKSLFPI